MTYFYRTKTVTSDPGTNPEFLEHVTQKKNWRITELPNGYFQAEYFKPSQIKDGQWVDITRRETVEECEEAIDKSIEHYKKKLEFLDGPKVVKTFN